MVAVRPSLPRQDHGVVYLLSGTAYAARLVVSLCSLRRHYAGPVAVLASDAAAMRLARRIARDRLLDIRPVRVRESIGRGRKESYLFKTRLHEASPFDRTLYLDCDTLVTGKIAPLFDLPSERHIAVTQFCDWVTTGKTICRRLRSWNDTHPELVPAAVDFGPAINTGVFAFTPATAVFERWHEVAFAGRGHFIPDEMALQLLLPCYPHVVFDGRFNCSARYGRPHEAGTRIIHYHGNRHLRGGCSRWREIFAQAERENRGGLREWAPAGDGLLQRHLQHRTGGVSCS